MWFYCFVQVGRNQPCEQTSIRPETWGGPAPTSPLNKYFQLLKTGFIITQTRNRWENPILLGKKYKITQFKNKHFLFSLHSCTSKFSSLLPFCCLFNKPRGIITMATSIYINYEKKKQIILHSHTMMEPYIPVCTQYIFNTVMVIWKSFTKDVSEDFVLQLPSPHWLVVLRIWVQVLLGQDKDLNQRFSESLWSPRWFLSGCDKTVLFPLSSFKTTEEGEKNGAQLTSKEEVLVKTWRNWGWLCIISTVTVDDILWWLWHLHHMWRSFI